MATLSESAWPDMGRRSSASQSRLSGDDSPARSSPRAIAYDVPVGKACHGWLAQGEADRLHLMVLRARTRAARACADELPGYFRNASANSAKPFTVTSGTNGVSSYGRS